VVETAKEKRLGHEAPVSGGDGAATSLTDIAALGEGNDTGQESQSSSQWSIVEFAMENRRICNAAA
jgi:hypothetical protein